MKRDRDSDPENEEDDEFLDSNEEKKLKKLSDMFSEKLVQKEKGDEDEKEDEGKRRGWECY